MFRSVDLELDDLRVRKANARHLLAELLLHETIEVPLHERFYLGGPNSLRGWKFRQVSPVDSTGFAVGGTTEVLGNAEYLIPLPFGLRLAGFFDVGNVYAQGKAVDPSTLRSDVGAGVRWLSPFGPIRVDYGVKLDRKSHEYLGAFQFSVGSAF